MAYAIDAVTLADLRQGMVHAARLVRRYGPIYWPVVERLQREVAALEAREALLADLLEDDSTGAGLANFG